MLGIFKFSLYRMGIMAIPRKFDHGEAAAAPAFGLAEPPPLTLFSP